MTREKESLKEKLEDIAGTIGIMSDYSCLPDYEKMALNLFYQVLESMPYNEEYEEDEEFFNEDLETAEDIFRHKIFVELGIMSEKLDKLTRKRKLTYEEARAEIMKIFDVSDNRIWRTIEKNIKNKLVKDACFRTWQKIGDYIYEEMRLN